MLHWMSLTVCLYQFIASHCCLDRKKVLGSSPTRVQLGGPITLLSEERHVAWVLQCDSSAEDGLGAKTFSFNDNKSSSVVGILSKVTDYWTCDRETIQAVHISLYSVVCVCVCVGGSFKAAD